jgi:hypothetical protein
MLPTRVEMKKTCTCTELAQALLFSRPEEIPVEQLIDFLTFLNVT